MSRLRRASEWLGLATAVVLLVGAAGCGGQVVPKLARVPNSPTRYVRTKAWRVQAVLGERTLRLVLEVGSCGEPYVIRALPVYLGDVVYIQSEVAFSKPTSKAICVGGEIAIYTTVRLVRNVEDVRIYDSGSDPPALRWPN